MIPNFAPDATLSVAAVRVVEGILVAAVLRATIDGVDQFAIVERPSFEIDGFVDEPLVIDSLLLRHFFRIPDDVGAPYIRRSSLLEDMQALERWIAEHRSLL